MSDSGSTGSTENTTENSPSVTPSPTRRTMLKGTAVGAGLAVLPATLLAACSSSKKKTGSSSGSTGGAAAGGGSITFGSNYSDPSTKAAFAALVKSATASTKTKICINTTDHNTF